MSYTTINGKTVKVNKEFKMDPNAQSIADMLADMLPNDRVVKLNAVHLKPTVKEDSDSCYRATYRDDFGSYEFEIHKTSAGYTVISDGNVCSKDNPEREYIIWNYECQVGAYMPKVLA
jgi:hypothetical protein